MTFIQLEIFTALAKFKSFTLVAEELNISQSAVSHALKALEKRWGVRLFHRSKNDVEITLIGYELLIYANEILNNSNFIEQRISDFKGVRSGKIRIGSFGSSSSNVLIPLILDKYNLKYPEVEVLIEEGTDKQISQWLFEGKIDIGFIVLPEEQLETYPIIEDIFVALVPKTLPLAQKKAISLEELAQYPFLMTSAGSQKHITNIFKKYNLNPYTKSTFSQILTIINMVNNNMGVSIIADMALDKKILELYPNVSKHPLSPNIKRSIGLAIKSKKHLSPILEAFIKIAQSI